MSVRPAVAFALPALLALLALAALLALSGCAAPSAPGTSGAASTMPPSAAALPDSAEESEQRRRARIRLELAANYYQQGNVAVALQELRQALAIDPNYAQAHGMLGLVNMGLGDAQRADAAFTRALALAPNDAEINNNYGWFLCSTGKQREAIGFFNRALADPLYRTPSKPLHNAGVCSLAIGDVAAAEAYLLRAFQFDPRDPVAMYNLSEIYRKRGDAERARFYAQRLLAAYEPTAQVLWLALRVERLARNPDGEASLAAQLKRKFPASAEAARLARGEFGD